MTADWSSTYSGSEEEILCMGTAIPPPTSLNTGDIQELSRVETPVTGEPAAGPADGIPPPNITPWEMTEPPPDTNWGPTREGRIQCQICWTHVWGGPTNLQRHLEFSRYCRYYQNRKRRGEAPSEDTARENEDGEYTLSYGSVSERPRWSGNHFPGWNSETVPDAYPPAPVSVEETPQQRVGRYLAERKKKKKREKPPRGEAEVQRKRRRTPSPSPGGGGAPSLRCKRVDNQTLLIQMFQ